MEVMETMEAKLLVDERNDVTTTRCVGVDGYDDGELKTIERIETMTIGQ